MSEEKEQPKKPSVDAGLIEKEHARYVAAAHRVQTSIAFMGYSDEAKHLRVGIDMSKSDMSGLATLLIQKGIFTTEEYLTAMADAAEREADKYEAELMAHYGVNIKTI